VVDHGLGFDLDALDAAEGGRVESAAGELEEALGGHAPTLEHLFDSGNSQAGHSQFPMLAVGCGHAGSPS
jgi:hypothetical protein